MEKIELSSEQAISKLKKLQIFSLLTEAEAKELLLSCDFYHFQENEKIIQQDDSSDFLCGILSGQVEVMTTGENGRPIKLGQVSEGDIVGETSLLMGLKRTANVVAKSFLEVVLIFKDKLLAFVNESPKAGLKIFGYIIFSLINKLKSINREMVFEKESTITAQDLEILKAYFKPPVEDFLNDH